MLGELLGATRDIGRLYEIATVLIKYGFGDVVQKLGLAGILEKAGRSLHWKQVEELARLERPTRVRRALEDLGPTFMKLGQVLATRVDIFPPEWIAEFSRLQDEAPAVPFSEIRRQMEEDLGAPPEEVFPTLESEPLAAASIAQVHRARTRDGEEVVVKVRRPGIRPILEADMRLLMRLADIIEEEFPKLRNLRPRDLARQFMLTLRREIDLASECRSAERMAAAFRSDPDLVIPKVHWEWTGERMNVQAFIEGIPGYDLEAMDRAGIDRKAIARKGADVVLRMVLEHGFFHADPHPGNFFILPEGRIALIDFGMVGRLSEDRKDQVVDLLYGLVNRESADVAEVLIDWAGDAQIDQERLRIDVDAYVDQYAGVPLKSFSMSAFLGDLMRILRDHSLCLPPDLAILVKVFITLEGFGCKLDPDFDMMAEATPFLRQAVLARYSPKALARRGWRAVASAVEVITGLPQDLRQLLRSARRGKLQVHIDVTKLETFGSQIDRAISRLTIGIVTAALIIGSAIVTAASVRNTFVATMGFLGACIGGIWLLLSIRHSNRGRR